MFIKSSFLNSDGTSFDISMKKVSYSITANLFPWTSRQLNGVFLNICLVICITPSLINNRSFDHILISRRCVLRVGTRFWVRGIDTEGQVANFVETEQIVEYEKVRCSYVQVCQKLYS